MAQRAVTVAAFAMAVVLMPALLFFSRADAATSTEGRVVVLGVPGLRWSDINATDTPTLWTMATHGSTGAMSIKTPSASTCPIGGWLTVSAGRRAHLRNGSCALPPAPTVRDGTATVPGFPDIRRDNETGSYEARIGLLGNAVHRADGCTLGVGPGGAFGAADRTGQVDHYAATLDEVKPSDWSRCPLAMVDIDDIFRAYIDAGVDVQGEQVPVSEKQRAAAAHHADQRIAQVLDALPSGTTVLVAGLSNTGPVPHLHAALATGPTGTGDSYQGHYLTANSTRRNGLVTLTDVTATALTALGLPMPKDTVGAPWRNGDLKPAPEATVQSLDDQDVAAQAYRRLSTPFWITVFVVQALLYGLAALALRRRWGGVTRRDRVLGGTRIVALAGASVPVSTFLANLLPWWDSPHPLPALVGCLAGAIVLITAIALAGPWRRSVTGPGLVIAALTALVLALDVTTGGRLQMCSFAGYSPIVAGRFYGFGNMAFAVFATSAMLTAGWLAGLMSRITGRVVTVGLVIAIGAGAVAVDGAPSWGADFGGILAIVPATAVLALLLAGRRVSLVKIGVIALTAIVIVGALAFADSLRPVAQQTHFGAFWNELLNGEAWGVVTRKFFAMLHSLRYWPFTVITALALGFLFLVLARPLSWRAAVLGRAYIHAPALRPTLIAVLVAAMVGMVVNDSGVVIPALAFSLAVPLALAAGIRALERDAAEDTSRPGPREQRSTSTA